MKKFFALALTLALALSLTACGGGTTPSNSNTPDNSAETPSNTDAQEPVTLRVAATSVPHAEILEQVKPLLAEQGIDLIITEYSDYVIPNTAVDEGDEDANYFQHLPYLEDFNANNGTKLVSAGAIHYEPFGIYAGKTDSLDKLAEGAKVAVPNDATNEARALLLLEAQGLIKLKEGAGVSATKNDIEENKLNLDIVEIEAAQLPRSLGDVDVAIINGNYAIEAGLLVADALATESADSLAATTYGNIVAVREGEENNEAIVALVNALKSDEVKAFIEETYQGAVVSLD